MPLSKNVDKCMSQFKREFPHGRSKKRKNKKERNKQAYAACKQASESTTFSFKDFLDIIYEDDKDNNMGDVDGSDTRIIADSETIAARRSADDI